MIYWRTGPGLVRINWWIEAQVSGLGVVPVGLGAPHDVGEGQLAVLLHRGEAKVLAAEEEQGVEEDDGGVGAQLLAVPQELFLHARLDTGCWEKEGEETCVRISEGSNTQGAALFGGGSPPIVAEGSNLFNMVVNSFENLA